MIKKIKDRVREINKKVYSDKQLFILSKLFIGSVIAIILILLYSAWFCTDTVNGTSMFPTLKNREIGILYTYNPKIEKGDIVAINAPDTPEIEGDTYIKRVIALGGDEIRIEETHTTCIVYVNGKKIDEPYYNQAEIEATHINEDTYDTFYDNYSATITVPDGELFVMGDNRPVSNDSRNFGTIKESDVVGKLIYH